MSITINKEKVVASEQIIEFASLNITKDLTPEGKIMAILRFDVKSETGEIVDDIEVKYQGDEYNTFWANFTSGKFLYQEALKEAEIVTKVPDTVESDFVNSVSDIQEQNTNI